MCMVLNWLNENAGIISCLATLSAMVSLIVAIKTNRRENKLANAAKLVMELSADKNTTDSYTLTIYNDSNACANNLEISSDTLKFNECYDIGDYRLTKYSVGLLRKGIPYEVSVKTDVCCLQPFYVTARWNDDYKEKNEKVFCVWNGNE